MVPLFGAGEVDSATYAVAIAVAVVMIVDKVDAFLKRRRKDADEADDTTGKRWQKYAQDKDKKHAQERLEADRRFDAIEQELEDCRKQHEEARELHLEAHRRMMRMENYLAELGKHREFTEKYPSPPPAARNRPQKDDSREHRAQSELPPAGEDGGDSEGRREDKQ